MALPEGYVGEKVPCIRTEDLFVGHPMRRYRDLDPKDDPHLKEGPWPGTRIYRVVPGGRELVGVAFDLRKRGDCWDHSPPPFEGLHPADTWYYRRRASWMAFDQAYAFEQGTLSGVVHSLIGREERHRWYDERRDRPRGRLAGRAPIVLEGVDAGAFDGLG